mmetsp:Transcript_84967/g.134214  ORF Transcript_84967/g.134214 Transcript_84967/m.134214 type:complete len:434 (+) Transcript_84967:85-1386(+)
MALASPSIWTPGSPIPPTPAALQGVEPAIWAVPTPSPSPMIKYPKEPRLEGERHGGGSTGSESPIPPLVSQEILWQVCQPFVGQMLEAMVKAIHQAQVEQLQASRPQQSSIASERVSTTLSPEISKHDPDAFGETFGGAFSSVFDVPKVGEPLRRLAEDDGEAGSASSSCPTPKTEKVHPQKVVCSQESSPVIQGKEPSFPLLLGASGSNAVSGSGGSDGHSNSTMPQKVHSPSMPEITEKHMSDINPMYLAWQQQHQGHPGFPPGHPGAAGAQRWADQRLSPTVSPMAPMTSPPGEGTTQLVLVDRTGALEDASSPDAPTAGSSDKSVMVCRHWKSKGWCRLEGDCKFLHLEHKRGPAPPAAKAGAISNASGSTSNAKASSEAPGATVATTGKRSGRSRRNRNSGNGASSGVQALAVGPISNTISAPAPGAT